MRALTKEVNHHMQGTHLNYVVDGGDALSMFRVHQGFDLCIRRCYERGSVSVRV